MMVHDWIEGFYYTRIQSELALRSEGERQLQLGLCVLGSLLDCIWDCISICQYPARDVN